MQKLIAEKEFLTKWLSIVLKASQIDLINIKSNYDVIRNAIESDWEGYDASYVSISLDFYNENALSLAQEFKNQVYSIGFNFYFRDDRLCLEIRKDSIDEEGHDSCPQDEDYLI